MQWQTRFAFAFLSSTKSSKIFYCLGHCLSIQAHHYAPCITSKSSQSIVHAICGPQQESSVVRWVVEEQAWRFQATINSFKNTAWLKPFESNKDKQCSKSRLRVQRDMSCSLCVSSSRHLNLFSEIFQQSWNFKRVYALACHDMTAYPMPCHRRWHQKRLCWWPLWSRSCFDFDSWPVQIPRLPGLWPRLGRLPSCLSFYYLWICFALNQSEWGFSPSQH